MFEQEFENLLSRYSDAIGIRSRFSGLVKDYFPGQQMQVNLILAAYDLGLAAEIEHIKVINNAFAYRFVKRLVEEYGISRVNADWVVSLWCVCYGQRILHKPCDIKLSSKNSAAPSIQEDKPGVRQYGDLFQYERSSYGSGLAVCGFTGENKHTIIFQNNSQNKPVVEIKDGAFSESQLVEAIMTEGYQRIGNRAFIGCVNLHQIIFPESLRELGDFSLAGCVALSSIALPPSLGQIGAYALSGTGLKTLQIPKSVYYLGEGVCSDCVVLDNMEIKENISDLPAKMFRGCSSLTKIRLHEKLNFIGAEAFAECQNLMTIYIPESVQTIGENAFAGVHEKFVLQCEFGSEAEAYARKHKIKYQLV